ncbi:hypothetical protein ACQR10_04375 [Bradyrhizobium sp. HKCCYLRH2060]|uniref:hypothetical protein n=1 Tax=Bradyrhizobium sp. HKCCYLRH2060 TaxID=3420743 RepID=UPI003EBDFF16
MSGDFDGAREPMRAIRDLIVCCEANSGFEGVEPGSKLARAQAAFTALHGDTRPAEDIADAAMIEPSSAAATRR